MKGGRAHPNGSELGYSTELAKCTIFGQSVFNWSFLGYIQGCVSVSKEDNLVKLPINLNLNFYNWDADSPEANYFPHRKWLRFVFAYSIYISDLDQDQQAYSLII